MEIKDILHPDCTLCAVQGTSKKKILELISHTATQQLTDIDQATILSSLMCREKMGSTGIGGGIALPHGRIQSLENVMALLITSETPIQFEAIDNAPVDIFFAILVPEEKASEHLGTLSAIAQKLNDKATLIRIRNAKTNQELFEAVN
ncbi:PTS IIA-like nitrogen regulatory protein PtsN [Paraglaciecola aquimarina]|uniref:PTS IIA-like nitrogen regulatory protein PtsN n=1 Tax=Paraglaciecola algarum TaxID=3050085 RepID=A0ABS9D6Z0_9ALTE|nr:PTS IIA-like nitrogen regulatory protein PtsN [Paraglaciecola sp. G1-23]MCF2947589.1 PTS IIA-like nitrogen regulatory protein PtsN [Paraglaciecola sp. G1-23]